MLGVCDGLQAFAVQQVFRLQLIASFACYILKSLQRHSDFPLINKFLIYVKPTFLPFARIHYFYADNITLTKLAGFSAGTGVNFNYTFKILSLSYNFTCFCLNIHCFLL